MGGHASSVEGVRNQFQVGPFGPPVHIWPLAIVPGAIHEPPPPIPGMGAVGVGCHTLPAQVKLPEPPNPLQGTPGAGTGVAGAPGTGSQLSCEPAPTPTPTHTAGIGAGIAAADGQVTKKAVIASATGMDNCIPSP